MTWLANAIISHYLAVFNVQAVTRRKYHCQTCEEWVRFGYCESNALLIVHGSTDQSTNITLGAG